MYGIVYGGLKSVILYMFKHLWFHFSYKKEKKKEKKKKRQIPFIPCSECMYMYTDKDLKETMAIHTRVLPQPCFGTLLLNVAETK